MSQSASRRAIHAFVSAKAHDRWHDFAAEEGISVSALIEAFAPELTDEHAHTKPIKERLEATVVTARTIDAARRRRST